MIGVPDAEGGEFPKVFAVPPPHRHRANRRGGP
ncbi:hypothetical protein [Streptomyces sp. NBC_00063]